MVSFGDTVGQSVDHFLFMHTDDFDGSYMLHGVRFIVHFCSGHSGLFSNLFGIFIDKILKSSFNLLKFLNALNDGRDFRLPTLITHVHFTTK